MNSTIDDYKALEPNNKEYVFEKLIRHLLLVQFWTKESEINYYHWQSEILGFRHQLEDRLTTNLRNYLAEEMGIIYNRALKQVKLKTKFQVDFPEICPYSLEQLLDKDYLG